MPNFEKLRLNPHSLCLSLKVLELDKKWLFEDLQQVIGQILQKDRMLKEFQELLGNSHC